MRTCGFFFSTRLFGLDDPRNGRGTAGKGLFLWGRRLGSPPRWVRGGGERQLDLVEKRTRVMRAPTWGLAKALRDIYWGGGGGGALPPARSIRPPSGVYKTKQGEGGGGGARLLVSSFRFPPCT
jgi:hypothetical protein